MSTEKTAPPQSAIPVQAPAPDAKMKTELDKVIAEINKLHKAGKIRHLTAVVFNEQGTPVPMFSQQAAANVAFAALVLQDAALGPLKQQQAAVAMANQQARAQMEAVMSGRNHGPATART